MPSTYVIQTVRVSRIPGECEPLKPPFPYYKFAGISTSPVTYSEIAQVVWEIPDPMPERK